MNCIICNKPHSKEQPLTIIEDMLPIGEVIAFCPDCLKEVEVVNIPPYVKSRVVHYGAKLKIGDRVLPLEGFEMS